MHTKGQGTIEYLVIIAIVVVIALVVVGLLVQLIGTQGSAIPETQAKSTLKSMTPISIVEWSRSGNVITVALKNTSTDTLGVNRFQFNATDKNDTPYSISANGGTLVLTKTLTVGTCTAGNKYSISKGSDLYIDYNSPTIAGQREYLTTDIIGTC